ncbi:hypothetical protein L1987_58520 [Smallanthus sonchifolius]|uniref:Uncharacterized protein n=1 Tax=Smallanthus sonchifolius TaxID=185202 RepID=A0ACB9DFZ4_9ASTR|nr:hypothetical protein L1987_58520 [Smallanthus sonchifolius]
MSFGSWDADNVPYTAYFENARKDKGTGVMINPNDPEQNPKAFMKYGGNDDIINDIMFDDKNINSDKSSNSNNKVTSQIEKRVLTQEKRRTIFLLLHLHAHPHRIGQDMDIIRPMILLSASVPMFGAWDDKDPKSAEGFTVIFQKVKEEKHIAATNFPPIPQQSTYNHNAPRKDTKRVKV